VPYDLPGTGDAGRIPASPPVLQPPARWSELVPRNPPDIGAAAYSDVAVRPNLPRGPGSGPPEASVVLSRPPGPAMSSRAAAAPGRLEFVDGVRALAALYVVVHHVYLAVYDGFPINTGPSVLTPLLYGHFGVAVFIVVSGFSLGLAPARRGWRLGRGGYWTFMRRRAWRLLPPYWAALAVSVAAVAVIALRHGDPVSWRGVATHFLLVQDVVEGRSPNGAFWSIAVEWQLYWVFPLLLAVRRRQGPTVLAVLTLAAVVALGIAGDHGGGMVVEKVLALSPQLGGLFVLGLLSAAVTSRPPGTARAWGFVAAGTGAAVVVTCAWLGTERAIGDLYWLDLAVGVATASGLAYATCAVGSRTRRALERRSLVGIGRFSYSLYLVHAPLLLLTWWFVVEPLDLPSGAALLAMVGVVCPAIVAVSYVFHVVVERPFLEHRSWADLRLAWARRRPAHLART
jgi:peptidoglycan/LPS O-acetylase OafA/YrhL